MEDAWLENPVKPTHPQLSLMEEERLGSRSCFCSSSSSCRFWRADFTLTWPGMCYTLEVDDPKGNNLVHLFLNTNRTFIIFVHDPQFFLYTYNPQAIPMTTWILPLSRTFLR